MYLIPLNFRPFNFRAPLDLSSVFLVRKSSVISVRIFWVNSFYDKMFHHIFWTFFSKIFKVTKLIRTVTCEDLS